MGSQGLSSQYPYLCGQPPCKHSNGLCQLWEPSLNTYRKWGTLNTGAVLGPHPHRTLLTSSLPQGLFSQTMEALDHMLQCFMVQNPTANELHFLLSVRASGSWGSGQGYTALARESQRGHATRSRTWPVGFTCLEVWSIWRRQGCIIC